MALQNINMKGDIKPVAEHLAFDKMLQKQMGFFPCDEFGKPIEQPADESVNEIKKKDVVVVDNDTIKDYHVEIVIPEGVEIINPLGEEQVEKPKRGRKPNVTK